ncbi:MAG: hypothetical protein JW757_09265 [Anaerolineales bacterium]|nr:hypothetical protein [Anaerolineales bacterium]
MPKIFYTERDIQDLFNSGVSSLVVNDDVVVTDLGREKAIKLGFELVREFDQPPSAPVRPYITEKRSPSAAPPAAGIAPKAAQIMNPESAKPAPAQSDFEERVFNAVKAKVGTEVDSQLLKVIIHRVVQNIGAK